MSTEKEPHVKDIRRFSFSRFKTFHTCPRKHMYQYIEQVETPDSEVTIPGKLFHEAIEKYLLKEDMTPVFTEFKELCRTGVLDLEADLLEYIVNLYLQFYAEEFAKETPIMVEETFTEELEGEDNIVVKVDTVFRKDKLVYLRDVKTTQGKIKYDDPGVRTNQQLLLYLPYVEEALQEPVQVIEIDEVKLSKLERVPINSNGKPSTDKKRLDLVTYEDYYDKLCSLNLEDNRDYDYILDYLRERGHPLFNRVTTQVLDRRMIEGNLKDMHNTYIAMKDRTVNYRVRGPLCNWCDFKELCDFDLSDPSPRDRDMLKARILLKKPRNT